MACDILVIMTACSTIPHLLPCLLYPLYEHFRIFAEVMMFMCKFILIFKIVFFEAVIFRDAIVYSVFLKVGDIL